MFLFTYKVFQAFSHLACMERTTLLYSLTRVKGVTEVLPSVETEGDMLPPTLRHVSFNKILPQGFVQRLLSLITREGMGGLYSRSHGYLLDLHVRKNRPEGRQVRSSRPP